MQDMSESSGESSWRYAGWRVAAGSGVAVFVSFSSLLVFTFGVFLKPLTAEFGWSREAVSLAFAIAALGVAVCSPLLGAMLDRFGPRRIILPSVAVFGLAFASLSLLKGQLMVLYATFALLGAVGNGTAQLAHSRAVASWFTRRRGLALAVIMAGSGTGAMLWPWIAQALLDRLGWRPTVAALGGFALVLGLPVVAALTRDNPAARRPEEPTAKVAGVRNAIWSRAFAIIVVVLFLGSLGQNGAIIHLSALLTDRGLPASTAALVLSTLGAASLLGRFVAGHLLDRFFAPRVAAFLLGAAALGAFVLASAHSAVSAVLAAVLIGIGMGGEADVTPYLLSRYFGLRWFSTLYGFTWTAYAIAGALGPVLMGRAFDYTGSYTLFLAGLSGLMLLAACLMLCLPGYSVHPAAGLAAAADVEA
jgi:MFS family permease